MERRVSLAVWLSLGAVSASCGGDSISHIEDGDDDGGASGDNAGSSGESGGSAATGGSTTGGNATGGSAHGGGGASGGGGAGGSAGDGGAVPCTGEVPPGDVVCNGDLSGTWIAKSCSLRVSGVVDLSGLGFSPECLAPVVGSLQVSGSVTFDGETYSDDTITTGESTFELEPECLLMATCDEVGNPLQTMGYASVRCVPNEATGCTCVGKVEQSGGLGFISIDASTYGTYATMGNEVTLTAFGIDTEYAFCVSPGADTLTLSLVTVAKTGEVADPIGFVKQ